MWRFIIFAAAAYLLYRMFAGDARKKKQTSEKEIKDKIKAGEMVKDPACGTYVSADSDIRVRVGETVHRFCSYECRDKFVRELEGGKSADS